MSWFQDWFGWCARSSVTTAEEVNLSQQDVHEESEDSSIYINGDKLSNIGDFPVVVPQIIQNNSNQIPELKKTKENTTIYDGILKDLESSKTIVTLHPPIDRDKYEERINAVKTDAEPERKTLREKYLLPIIVSEYLKEASQVIDKITTILKNASTNQTISSTQLTQIVSSMEGLIPKMKLIDAVINYEIKYEYTKNNIIEEKNDSCNKSISSDEGKTKTEYFEDALGKIKQLIQKTPSNLQIYIN
jgi:hypothetical protein